MDIGAGFAHASGGFGALRRGAVRSPGPHHQEATMTSIVTAAADASTAPAWLHLTVMAIALLVLFYSLARHSN
ncbi:hypothetical protein RB196_29545 [Streptomyces sp. PmtA]|uniref:hypothetical protein n=1 Tax=Streptomyces sp. PmtA TaxID=3074275 RepID=UPI003014318A